MGQREKEFYLFPSENKKYFLVKLMSIPSKQSSEEMLKNSSGYKIQIYVLYKKKSHT